MFINYSHPSQYQNKQNRNAVQSHASRTGRRKRAPIFLSNRKTQPFVTISIQDENKFRSQSWPSKPHYALGVLPASKQRKSDHHSKGSKIPQKYETPIPRESSHARKCDERIAKSDRPPHHWPSCVPNGHLAYADPFKIYPIEAGEEVCQAVDFWINTWAPSQQPGSHARKTTSNPLLSTMFPLALQNVELFEAVVAMSQSFCTVNRYGMHTKPSRDSLFHRGNSLKRLRSKLQASSGQIDDSCIVTTTYLMLIDELFNDVAAHEAHFNGLREMVAIRGGIDNLGVGNLLKSLVLWLEFTWMMYKGEKSRRCPLVPDVVLQYPQYLCQPDIYFTISSLPGGFRDLASDGEISVQLVDTLSRVSRWTTLLEKERASSLSCEDSQFLDEYDVRRHGEEAVRYSKVCRDGVERCIWLAIVMYNPVIAGSAHKYFGYQRILNQLDQALRVLLVSGTRNTDCLIWLMVFTAGASTWKTSDHPQGFLMYELLLRYPELQRWDTLEGILRKFLWSSPLMKDWKTCWHTAVDQMGF